MLCKLIWCYQATQTTWWVTHCLLFNPALSPSAVLLVPVAIRTLCFTEIGKKLRMQNRLNQGDLTGSRAKRGKSVRVVHGGCPLLVGAGWAEWRASCLTSSSSFVFNAAFSQRKSEFCLTVAGNMCALLLTVSTAKHDAPLQCQT